MNKAAGIDYGVRRVAIAIPDINVFDELLLKNGEDLDNLFAMASWVGEKVLLHKPDLVIVEKQIQGISGNVRTGLSLGMVAGAFAFSVKLLGPDVELIGPSSWKKAVVGRGNADKKAVSEWLESTHPEYFKQCKALTSPQDAIASTCLALYGKKLLAGRRSL